MLDQDKLVAVIKLSLAKQLLFSVTQDICALQDDLNPHDDNAEKRYLIDCLDSLIRDLVLTKDDLDVVENCFTELYVNSLRFQHSQSGQKNADGIVDIALTFLAKNQ